MHFFGMEASSVQLRVGAPSLIAVRKHRSRASAQASIISPLCPGQHWGLRPAFALRALAWQAIYASLQQPVDFFCKEIMPGQHRREAPLLVDGSELIVERPRTPRNGLSSLNHQLSSLNRFPLA